MGNASSPSSIGPADPFTTSLYFAYTAFRGKGGDDDRESVSEREGSHGPRAVVPPGDKPDSGWDLSPLGHSRISRTLSSSGGPGSGRSRAASLYRKGVMALSRLLVAGGIVVAADGSFRADVLGRMR